MSDCLRLRDVELWYDEQGSGRPVTLLHGNFSDARDFAGNLDTLASSARLLLPERRGHGHTADVVGPITVADLVTDTIEFIERVAGGPSAVVGYSTGACVALCVAVRRPDLVSELVLISGAFDTAAYVVQPDPDGRWPRQVVDAYGDVSPDGRDHFPVVARKTALAFLEGLQLNAGDVARIACPTLVISADDDLVPLEHTLELYRALPDGDLAVVPGSSHLLLLEHPELCTRLVGDFLFGRRGARLMPVAR
ncbi:alpha/beta fold hydrolase [Agromyces salentinus]|uniref:Alpha/beta hydrolase n=1 Tax=Agromyces salentinus TaxID=269421 RepID=A0ABN2MGU9_9MICO|nr:alpha/beta hydrolase [Agromyces salentinus]